MTVSKSMKRFAIRHKGKYQCEVRIPTVEYPTRCRIVDVTGQEIYPGIVGRTPEVSKPHIGKEGLAENLGQLDVRITLDDGTILEGCDCWWESIP